MASDSSLFRAVFNGTNDAVVELDRNHRIVRVNPAFERMFGYTPEYVLGRPVEELLVPNAPHRGSTASRIDGSASPFLLLFQAADGRHIDGESVTAPIETDDELDGFLLLIRDATDRRRQEKFQALLLLIARSDSEQLNDALVSALLYAMELTGAQGASLMTVEGEVLANVGRPGTGSAVPCVAAGETVAVVGLHGGGAASDPRHLEILTRALGQRIRGRGPQLTVSLDDGGGEREATAAGRSEIQPTDQT